MTAPNIVHTTFETISPVGVAIVCDLPTPAQQPERGLQDVEPSEMLFFGDALRAAPNDLLSRYPADVVESSREKINAATFYSITLSMRDTTIRALIDPVPGRVKTDEELDIEHQSPLLKGEEVSEEETMRYVPDFDEQDGEPLDAKTAHQIECAFNLALHDIQSGQRSERANQAVAFLALAKAATEGAGVCEEKAVVMASEWEQDPDELKQAESIAFDELAAAHKPILLTHREKAFMTDVIHCFDPEDYRDMQVRGPERELQLTGNNAADFAAEIFEAVPEAEKDAPRLPTAQVQEVLDERTRRERVAVWMAGAMTRLAVERNLEASVGRIMDNMYARFVLYRSLLLQ